MLQTRRKGYDVEEELFRLKKKGLTYLNFQHNDGSLCILFKIKIVKMKRHKPTSHHNLNYHKYFAYS